MGKLTVLESLKPVLVWEMVTNSKTLVVDVREPLEFALGHPPGSLNVPYSLRGLNDRLLSVYNPGNPVVVMANESEQALQAANQLQDGSFEVSGVIVGGISSWMADDLPVQTLSEIKSTSVSSAMSEGASIVLDVREPIEWEMGYIPGAMLMSLGDLKDHLGDIPLEVPILVICEAGIRSSSAASLLLANGFNQVVNVVDGTAGYRNNNLPLAFYADG